MYETQAKFEEMDFEVICTKIAYNIIWFHDLFGKTFGVLSNTKGMFGKVGQR